MLYRLRWRFEYSDGKTPRIGPWFRPSKEPSEMAAFQPKENLLWAVIEAENMKTWEVSRAAECPGEDFCNFEWVAGASIGTGGDGLRHDLIGLKIRARNKTIQVLNDGSVSEEIRSEQDKKFHLAGYGK